MTATGHKVTGSVAKERRGYGIGTYFAVGLLALALGIGAVLASVDFVGGDTGPTPADIAEIRAELLVDRLETQWAVQANSAREAARVEHLTAQHAARMQAIQSQRAEDMVEHMTGKYSAQLRAINEQRAADMVEFQRGGSN